MGGLPPPSPLRPARHFHAHHPLDSFAPMSEMCTVRNVAKWGVMRHWPGRAGLGVCAHGIHSVNSRPCLIVDHVHQSVRFDSPRMSKPDIHVRSVLFP
jgi:hypothetical protein